MNLRHITKASSSGLLCRQFAGLANGANATKEARLLLAGPDASGIVASFSHLLFSRGCGIVDCTSESSEIDAKVDKRGQHSRRMFFQRILFDYSNVSVERDVLKTKLMTCALDLEWKVNCHGEETNGGGLQFSCPSTITAYGNSCYVNELESWTVK